MHQTFRNSNEWIKTFSNRSNFLRALYSICGGLILLQGAGAQLKPWADPSVFSMNESQLRSAYPELKKITTPKIGARGVRGQWTLPDVNVGGHSFDSVLYARDGKIQRIEHVWSGVASPCLGRAIYDDVVAELTSQIGQADASDDAMQGSMGQRSAVWTVGETYLITYVNELDYQCFVRIVNRPKLIKDASAL